MLLSSSDSALAPLGLDELPNSTSILILVALASRPFNRLGATRDKAKKVLPPRSCRI